jgi:hypothetical protein
MIRYDPNTSSDILRSTHILAVAIQSASAGEWTVSGRYRTRTVEMAVRLDRVLKGMAAEPEGATVAVEVRQFQPAGDFLFAVPGAWSNRSLAAGEAYLAFSIASGGTLGSLLADPQCRRVFPSREALPDVELALLAGSPEISIPMLLARTADRKGLYGALFAGYLAARLPELMFRQLADFDRAMREFEDPAFSGVARSILFEDIYTKMIMLDPAPPQFVARLIEGTVRVLALPGNEGLGRSIARTYLPNLLGLEGAAERKSANAVFEGKPELRARAAAAFQSAGESGVVAWIRS